MKMDSTLYSINYGFNDFDFYGHDEVTKKKSLFVIYLTKLTLF